MKYCFNASGVSDIQLYYYPNAGDKTQNDIDKLHTCPLRTIKKKQITRQYIKSPLGIEE